MDQQNQLQESNLSEPDALSNCSTNDVLADLDHKLKIETERANKVTETCKTVLLTKREFTYFIFIVYSISQRCDEA